MLAVAIIALGVLGLAMLALGLRGRRVGDEPRCRGCGYNLTGVESAKCPECGRVLIGRAVVRGRRVRWPRWIALGGCMLLAASCVIVPAVYCRARGINIWSKLPFAVVFQAAKANKSIAIGEVYHRTLFQTLSAAECNRVAEWGLAQQALPRGERVNFLWVHLLDQMRVAKLLSPQQEELFIRQWIKLELVVRPTVRESDPVAVAVRCVGRGPGGTGPILTAMMLAAEPWGMSFEQESATSAARGDDNVVQQLEMHHAPLLVDLSSGELVNVLVLPPLPLGRHHPALTLKCASAIEQRNETLHAQIDVVPADTPLHFEAIDGAVFADTIASFVSVTEVAVLEDDLIDDLRAPNRREQRVKHINDRTKRPTRIAMHFSKNIPLALAFDVFVVGNDGECHVPELDGCYYGYYVPDRTVTTIAPLLVGDTVFIELRPNPAHLMRTVDQQRYWGRAIRIGPIEVRDAKTSPGGFRDWSPPLYQKRSTLPSSRDAGAVAPS